MPLESNLNEPQDSLATARFETILYEKQDRVATIKLNRPRVLNAMNKQLWLEFQQALDDVETDPDIKVLIVTGEGRAFSTGADLKDSKDRTIEQYRDYLVELQEASRRLIRFDKPTIAAVNGYALGSGHDLALACDIRIMADEAQLGDPEVKVTSAVTGGASRLVQDLIGPAKAKEYLFTGDNLYGKDAEKIGLVNRSVPLARLMEETRELALKIAGNSSFSIKMIKKELRLAQGEASLEAVMDFEIEACLACVSTKERQASLEKFESRKDQASS